jgi:uncharacterized membrane protein
MLPIRFEHPGWLILLVLIIPCFFMARRSIGGLSRGKATLTFAIRVIVILLLATALAHPIWEKRGKGLTVSILIDKSQSIPLPLKASSVSVLQKAVTAKENRDDRVAVISIAKDANILAMPDSYSAVPTGGEEGDLTATNLAAGLHMAMAIMPDDTANRIVLVSDGNETEDSVLAAAELAKANKVPIDVLLLEYEHRNEVIFERIIAPARARQGQSANIRMALRTQNPAKGTVRLKMNGQPIDLNGSDEGDGMRVELTPGSANVFPVTVSLDSPGPQQFDAVFEPDSLGDDDINRNNSAVAVTFVGGQGKVLVIDDGNAESEYLVRALQESDIAVDVRGPEALAGGSVMIAGYDAIVLANIPRSAIADEEDAMLHAYVHDLGGGLVMLGGDQSFGAGGWLSSQTSKVLPVKLDPPQTKQMVRGALALIMHSCEMPQGNFWGQRVAIAAIEALSSLDYVGICVFGWGQAAAPGINGATWAFPMAPAGDKSAPIAAAKQMAVGDMPDFGASMQLAYNGLMGVRAGQRHAIVISDGDPSPPTQALINQYIAAKITITTVMVAGHGSASDRAGMNYVATQTGGRFYEVKNPKNLPQIFIKEAQVVSRSLIQEGDVYQPRVASRLPGPIEGFGDVPAIDGYILTAPREGLTQIPIVIDTKDGADPIYAHWNYGLGKSIAYTSDLTGKWGARWASWAQFRAFWEQSIRWVMRPSSPANFAVNTRQEGDRAVVEVEALEANASFLNFMQTNAVVLHPDNIAEPLSLQQIGPGRYRGEFKVAGAGAYLINVNYSAGGNAESATKGNLQAAISVPYSREFKSVKHNAALLKQLAEMTKGRELNANDLNLFEPENLEIPKSPREIWDLLAIIAAALFVFDVAARRVSIDPRLVALLAGRAIGKRVDASTETVSAWKRTRSQVAHRKTEEKPKRTAEDRQVKFEATQDDASLAIDVGAETPKDMRATPEAAPKPKPSAQTPQDDGDYTSRLLAAKRRARGDDENPTGSKDKPNA